MLESNLSLFQNPADRESGELAGFWAACAMSFSVDVPSVGPRAVPLSKAAIIDLSRGEPFRRVRFLGAVWAECAERTAIETEKGGKTVRQKATQFQGLPSFRSIFRTRCLTEAGKSD